MKLCQYLYDVFYTYSLLDIHFANRSNCYLFSNVYFWQAEKMSVRQHYILRMITVVHNSQRQRCSLQAHMKFFSMIIQLFNDFIIQ